MSCRKIESLLGAYVDQELEAQDRRLVAAHLEDCGACSATAAEIGFLGRRLAAIGHDRPPEGLQSRISAALAGADAKPSRIPASAGHPRVRALRQAAVIAVACGLTALLTFALLPRPETGAPFAREIVSAHIRSLLQESPTQIASADMHTVKPWFNGRIDFVPAVKDLASEGFPLIGARLDYVDERRAAALVYQRRRHIVNVFVWPARPEAGTAPGLTVHNGYTLLLWSKDGIMYAAVSDLNAEELRQLQSLL